MTWMERLCTDPTGDIAGDHKHQRPLEIQTYKAETRSIGKSEGRTNDFAILVVFFGKGYISLLQ